MVAQTNHQITNYAVKNKWHSDLFTNGKNLHGKKPYRVIFKSPLLKFHYLSQQVVTSKGTPIPYINLQLNPYPNTQLDLFCNDNFLFWCMAPKYVTNQCDARITVRGLLFCMNPSTWLTPQQPFDYYSWFAAASHRNTNNIFNVGTRDFAWLQNLKAYKKRSKNSFFCRRRLGFQKENLMKLSRVLVFLFPTSFK